MRGIFLCFVVFLFSMRQFAAVSRFSVFLFPFPQQFVWETAANSFVRLLVEPCSIGAP